MIEYHEKIGIIVPCWDKIAQSPDALAVLLKHVPENTGVIILSRAATNAPQTALRKQCPRSLVTDIRLLSPARLARLCTYVLNWEEGALKILPPHPDPLPQRGEGAGTGTPRFGLIVSNGYGLGHVTRMRAVAEGLKPYGPCAFMSFSAGLWKTELSETPVFYLPSAQYLELPESAGRSYTAEAARRFIRDFSPTHILYDGNVLPEGLLTALSAHPDIHLTWLRRGMWQDKVAPRFMAPQALADLVWEPGDLAESYDTGPSWNARMSYAPPRAFLKTPPVRPVSMKAQPLSALGLDPQRRYVLIMLGACQKDEDLALLKKVVAGILEQGDLPPVIAHWPMSHTAPPQIEGAVVIEKMPLAPYYAGFDLIISATGYNSFHEILTAGTPVIFMPQEDETRDQQIARARYAQDQGWAQLCRRQDIHHLPQIISLALNSEKTSRISDFWLKDWEEITQALNIPSAASAPETRFQSPLNKAHRMDNSRWMRLMRATYRRWKARSSHTCTDTQFILALNMDETTFTKRMTRRRLELDDMRSVIITNSIDPVTLRRGGYAYVWLNMDNLKSPYAVQRQILCWLKIWRPAKWIKL